MEPTHNVSTNSRFNQTGYLYMNNVISEEERHAFTDIMLRMKEENALRFEGVDRNGGDSSFYKNSFGGNSPEFEAALRQVQPRMEEELGVKLTPQNSYARIYYNDAILRKHKDREGLDYTLSITLFSNVDPAWPLWCIDTNNISVPIIIREGDGAMMLGTKLTHWREPLVCNHDQMVVQLFMHWS